MSDKPKKMQDFSKLPALKKALEEIVKESDVDNGTGGMEFLAYWYNTEYITDKDRQKLNIDLARAAISGTPEEVIKIQKELDALERPDIMMEWRLVTPIPLLKGTKQMSITRGDRVKKYELSMTNVKSIYISEKVSQMRLLEWEETDATEKDSQGRDTKVLKIRLVKGLIDVAAPIMSRGKEVRGKRAYVVPVSYRAMQIAGSMLFRENLEDDRLTGYDEIS